MHRRKLLLAIVGASLLGANGSSATTWTEVGDAGELLGTAQEPSGSGFITQIDGTIDSIVDRDLFRIQIDDPSAFSAFTTGGDPINAATQLDAMLALFDASGFGIVLNDDGVFDDGNAALGGLPSGAGPGIYYLAIFDDDTLPVSGSGVYPDDLIWSAPVFPYTGERTPDGGGAGSPLSGWVAASSTSLASPYSIFLTGARFVPEPSTGALALAAAAGLSRWRRAASRRARG